MIDVQFTQDPTQNKDGGCRGERERERDDMIVVQLTQNPTQNNIGVYMCRRGRKLYEKSNQNMDDRFTVIWERERVSPSFKLLYKKSAM